MKWKKKKTTGFKSWILWFQRLDRFGRTLTGSRPWKWSEWSDLQGPMQNEYEGPLAQKVLRISSHLQQSRRPNMGPFRVLGPGGTCKLPLRGSQLQRVCAPGARQVSVGILFWRQLSEGPKSLNLSEPQFPHVHKWRQSTEVLHVKSSAVLVVKDKQN